MRRQGSKECEISYEKGGRMNFRVRIGSVPGREHLRLSINNQDSARTGELVIEGQSYLFGVVCDGCSGGNHNEVGAHLLANYICSEIPMILSTGTSIQDLPSTLFTRCVGYLRGIASLTVVGDASKMIDFISNQLLATIVGFVMNQEQGIMFSAGDGVIIQNNEVTRINQKDRPMYPAYQLIDRRHLNLDSELPQSFSVWPFAVAQLERLAVCSDGIEEALISGIWGHEHLLGLHRFLKRESTLNRKFLDDCTVITVEKARL